MQSVFSLAARRRAVPVLRDVRGRDGELKTDWTKPRAAAPIYGDCFRGPDHQGGNCSPPGGYVDCTRDAPARVRRIASRAPMERRRAVSMTERMSA